MATHSSILVWKIPQTEEPGGLYSPWGHKDSDATEHTDKVILYLTFWGTLKLFHNSCTVSYFPWAMHENFSFSISWINFLFSVFFFFFIIAILWVWSMTLWTVIFLFPWVLPFLPNVVWQCCERCTHKALLCVLENWPFSHYVMSLFISCDF